MVENPNGLHYCNKYTVHFCSEYQHASHVWECTLYWPCVHIRQSLWCPQPKQGKATQSHSETALPCLALAADCLIFLTLRQKSTLGQGLLALTADAIRGEKGGTKNICGSASLGIRYRCGGIANPLRWMKTPFASAANAKSPGIFEELGVGMCCQRS